ncbi:probable LRR receptor-like serine/threonine-protein kinase At3g47570 [Magnolia sinica]|uniref:probable LRR receptor-like serine/threonine-protein kinase At3g47570 n=1 Tax=Magnolia sinica TaxID=86752 RepID=UPI00265B14EB|nr:probable LRR receptor-like serine/threonine-protein kinase At3g47570 [Magnolia sinica]
MEELPHAVCAKGFQSLWFGAILLFSINISWLESATISGNETDRLALLVFKDSISSDPLRALVSWNHTLHFCDWLRITCDIRRRRVQVLNLQSKSLVGSLPPNIANLTFLEEINLQNNSFYGPLPQELGRLSRLQRLNLGNNSFGGGIPANLSSCSDLRVITLIDNIFVGRIPAEFSSLSKLIRLHLPANNLTGIIPPSFGNLSSLTHLSLARNSLEGSIPEELGRITSLKFLQISQNELSGTIPSSLYNVSSIYFFSVASNKLYGRLPPHLGLSLPNLRVFLVGGNQFTGPIPISLSNASGLVLLDFAFNNLSGPVPMNLGSLHNLSVLNFVFNQLGGSEANDLSFITSLTNCSRLEVLALSSNQFKGVLPNSFTNLSTHLRTLMMGRNQISVSIPPGIQNLVNLTSFVTQWNEFTGTIPDSIGKLSKLQALGMTSNKFSGWIPASLGNLTLLNTLYLDGNNLGGSIPASLGNCQNLQALDLSGNNLTGNIPSSLGNCQRLLELYLYQNYISGSIPKEVLSISSLSISLNLAQNSLTGRLPLEVGNLKNLERLDISENKLSGEIPSTLGSCISLESLRMEVNFLQGIIPLSLRTLRGIEVLDLSRNNLSGHIPRYLAEFSFLKNLNLSFNSLEGEIPIEGIFRNASVVSIRGNSKLCGGTPELQFPACHVQASKRRRWSLALKITSPIITVFICLVLCIGARCWLRKIRKKPSSMSSMGNRHIKLSYAELLKATNGFSSENLIGEGGYGSVYKGILDGAKATTVAVKVLNLAHRGASESFVAECEALRNVRHRNIVKILTSCSSLDFKGNDFKALVFEFMSNGSLESWLHQKEDRPHQWRKFSLIQRINVAIDVASALDYLHQGCQMPVIHGDLKPSNVLLNDDMNAHVSDFGLARFLHQPFDNSSSIGIKGSIGYVAPESGLGSQPSILGDVYSYGILLLEMFTGKRPTDEMFKDGLNLHKLARMSLPERVMEIIDPLLLSQEEEINGDTSYNNMTSGIKCLALIISIGVTCSTEMPRERMEMKDIVVEMHAIRDLILAGPSHY